MKERDYILATNLARLYTVNQLLRQDVLITDGIPTKATSEECSAKLKEAVRAVAWVLDAHQEAVGAKK